MSEFSNLIESKVYKAASTIGKMIMLKDLKHYTLESGCDANCEFYKLFEILRKENPVLDYLVVRKMESLIDFKRLEINGVGVDLFVESYLILVEKLKMQKGRDRFTFQFRGCLVSIERV